MSLKDFNTSLLYDEDNSDFSDLFEKQTTKNKHHRIKFACKIIWVIILCVLLILLVIIGICYLAYLKVAPPELTCTYSVDALYTSEIASTGVSHSYSLKLYSLNEGSNAKYSEVSTYPHNDTLAVVIGGKYHTSVPFFDRRICTRAYGPSMCLSISALATRAKWRTPCPSDSSLLCNVYTRQWKSNNETWYIFPEKYGNIPNKRVPSGYYIKINNVINRAVFTNYNFTAPDSTHFEFDYSGYCYDTHDYSTPNTRFVYKPGVRTLIPTERAYDLINDPLVNVSKKLSREVIQEHLPWERGNNPCFDGLTYADMRQYLMDEFTELPISRERSHNYRSVKRVEKSNANADIPESFDCEEKWSHCKSVTEIRNQGSCGSCWAFGISEVLADRTCIATGANLTLSPQYLMDCVSGRGCLGWVSDLAWDGLAENGTTTEECMPYKEKATVCQEKCADGTEPVLYKSKDAHSIYVEGNFTETSRLIQLDIMENGPVIASMFVYDDLYKYKTGVYYHGKSASYSGKHIVKIVGWGLDNKTGLPYWRVANSWSSSFGENGYFRILRGSDESGIEYAVSAGYPLI